MCEEDEGNAKEEKAGSERRGDRIARSDEPSAGRVWQEVATRITNQRNVRTQIGSSVAHTAALGASRCRLPHVTGLEIRMLREQRERDLGERVGVGAWIRVLAADLLGRHV